MICNIDTYIYIWMIHLVVSFFVPTKDIALRLSCKMLDAGASQKNLLSSSV